MKGQIFAVAMLLMMLGMVAALAAPQAHAATTFTVNQTADLVDASLADNRCDTSLTTSGDQCSLRAAIQQANATAGTDTITFVSTAAHKITRAGTDNTSAAGDFDITSSIILQGRAPATTIDGNSIDRVFHVLAGTVTMQNLIVRGGNISTFGGGMQIESGANVTLTNVTVRNNFAADNTGGIENFGALTLNQVTVTANSTNDSVGGLASGRNINTTASLSIQNSTIANNTGLFDTVVASNGSIVNSTMGGLVALGSISLRNVTLNLLQLCDGTGGCGSAGATNLFNTIVGTCNGTFSSLGYNLIQNAAACTLTGNLAGNLLNVNPLLGPLQNNGGSTDTRALLSGSPALDAGNPSGCVFGNNVPLTTDQRGLTRPKDGNGDANAVCDMGAFEAQTTP